MSTQVSAVPTSPSSKIRNSTDFPPNVWENYFLTCTADLTIDARTQEQHEAMKEAVRKMITTTTTQNKVLQLIDTVQRLGVAYHFEKEIENTLVKIFQDHEEKDIDDNDDDDLYIVALRFRLIRQQGIKISCDVFNKFRDEEGKYFFKESLIKDVEGMLSLYEAAYLGTRGEKILDEAIAFTTAHLKSIVSHICPILAQQINHALHRPLRKTLPRLEARYFLDIYARDASHNQTLLEFAKFDFNILQAEHQKELIALTRWWTNLDFKTSVHYARNRFVECYFWALGNYFEPKYALGRNILAKIICIITVIDDTFDAYGTYEELQLFIEASRGWDIGAVDTLPDYMKIIYKTLLVDIYDQIEEELTKQERSHLLHYGKEKMQEMIESYFVEATWLKEGYIPTMDEYNSLAIISSGILMLTTNSLLGMGDFATEDTFKWIGTNPKIFIAGAVICRFLNDIEGHEFEQKRDHIPSAVECYMNECGVFKEAAVKALNEEVENAWKDINEEFLMNPSAVPFPLLERILNLSRICEFLYKDGDRFTNPHLMIDQVASILKDPVML